MAKAKQPYKEASTMIEGDAMEKSGQLKKSSSTSGSAETFEAAKDFSRSKKSEPVFLIASVALVLSFVAIGFSSVLIWKSYQRVAIDSSHSEESLSFKEVSEFVKNRFAMLEAKIAAGEDSRQKAIAALSQRLDKGATFGPISNVDSDQNSKMAERINQRFIALEAIVKDLADAAVSNTTDETVNGSISSDLSFGSDQAIILIVSGLLADNMAGAPLDRWIELLQKAADQGVTIPNLAQLRIAANPTPKHPLILIRTGHHLIPKMAAALNQVNEDAGFLEKMGAKLGQLVRLREIGDGANGNEAALQVFETALEAQDLDGAVYAASQWSGLDVPELQNWLLAAQNRQSLDRKVSLLVTAALPAYEGAMTRGLRLCSDHV